MDEAAILLEQHTPALRRYAFAMLRQQDAADDFVIGTGETHSVREFVQEAFAYAGLDWEKHVKISERYLRPLEVDVLIADASKARTELG